MDWELECLSSYIQTEKLLNKISVLRLLLQQLNN